jgi:hypothetical protein
VDDVPEGRSVRDGRARSEYGHWTFTYLTDQAGGDFEL